MRAPATLEKGLLMTLALLLLTMPGDAATPAEERARAFAQLPNWTGQWEIVGVTPDAQGGYSQSLAEVVRGMRKWGPPPYKPDARVAFEKAAAKVQEGSDAAANGTDAPVAGLRAACSFGVPMLMLFSPLMFEVLTTPEETAMIFSGREIRHIYTDGRPHTPKDELWPTPWGDSIGHWEGQTLVVDTIDVSSPSAQDRGPSIVAGGGDNDEVRLIATLSTEVHFIERIRMLDPNHLEDQMTIIDPKNFTAPWHVSRQYDRVTRIHRMVHEDCEGEDRNPVVNGKFTVAPPPPAQTSGSQK